ncbi:TetR/AcrR family transcriptional regulator [Brucellaceae bacterium C25G]
MARPREIDKDRILNAAEEIITESMGRGFTLDAVAERAGVSKGGLVYAFPTKDALIEAALTRELNRFKISWRAKADHESHSNVSMLSAYIAEIQSQEEIHLRTASLLMTALSNAPTVSEPARAFYRSVFSYFNSDTKQGKDIRQAILAIEGLFFLRGMGLIDSNHSEWLSVVTHAQETLSSALKDKDQ